MRKLKTAIGLLLIAVITEPSVYALQVSGLFSDHMVLQCEREVPVWGWAEPGTRVTVTFGDKRAHAVTDAHGTWKALLPPMKAQATPQDLVVEGRETIRVSDVLVGDVWLGSGQSNMEMPVRDIDSAKEEIAAAQHPLIRLFTVPRNEKNQVATDVPSSWLVCKPETVPNFSAVLYLFGREIQAQAGIPLGLIHSSVGGTRIELWTAPEGLITEPAFAGMTNNINHAEKLFQDTLPARLEAIEAWLPKARSALSKGARVPMMPDWPQHPNPNVASLYRSMIYPLVPFALRGVVWYQGEWNGGENEVYVQRMRALIAGWRAVWNMPEMPFYYVQLARMPQKDCLPWQGDGLSPTREAQRKSLAIPHTGMATIIDLEGSSGWHPANKQDVAKRLALWALRNEYGQKDLVVSGPLYKEHVAEGSAIRIRFDSLGSGLVIGVKSGRETMRLTPEAPLKNFAIAGSDKRWVHAKAVIAGNDVVVSSPEVQAPVAVRYAYCQDPVGCNLFNKEGLPASPFRTDDW